MKELRLLAVLSVISIVVFLQACGGGGGNSGTGTVQSTTVTLKAQTKSGSPNVIQSRYSSGTFSMPTLDFTITSVINPGAGAFASDVNITSSVTSYEFLDATPALALNLRTIPPLTYTANMIVPAGGTLDWSGVPMLLFMQTNALFNNLSGYTGEVRYLTRTTFSGKEAKSGTKVSVTTTSTLIVDKPI